MTKIEFTATFIEKTKHIGKHGTWKADYNKDQYINFLTQMGFIFVGKIKPISKGIKIRSTVFGNTYDVRCILITKNSEYMNKVDAAFEITHLAKQCTKVEKYTPFSSIIIKSVDYNWSHGSEEEE